MKNMRQKEKNKPITLVVSNEEGKEMGWNKPKQASTLPVPDILRDIQVHPINSLLSTQFPITTTQNRIMETKSKGIISKAIEKRGNKSG